MGENEIIDDLGDIRVAVLDADIHPTEINKLVSLIDEKMSKYRGKEVIING